MRSLIRNRGSLCLISLAVGWGISALAFWVLAEAHWQTVLWAFFARAFLVLAVASGSLALVLMLVRSMPKDASERTGHLLRWAPGALLVSGVAWLASIQSAQLYPGLMVFAAVIGGLFTIDRRIPPGGGYV